MSFDVTVGLSQGCVMLPWLFNLFMDGVAREWKARILNAGVYLNEGDGRHFRVSSLLFADDAVLVAVNEECLQRMATEIGVVCGRRKLKVSGSKVMNVSKSGEYVALNVQLNGE